MGAGLVMSGSDAPSVEAVLLVSEGIREAQFTAFIYCKCREDFYTLLRKHLQTINTSQVKTDFKHECDGESCSQDGHGTWRSSLLIIWKDHTFLLLYVIVVLLRTS